MHTGKKATIGLGLGLPSDVLITHVNRPMVGLGIVMEYGFLDILDEEAIAMASPPLLATRRSPPKPQAESPGSEFRPMRTPSPSLLATSGVVGAAVSGVVVRQAARAHVGLGIELPCLQDTELVTTFDAQSTARAGLSGLDLSFLEDDDDYSFFSSGSSEETSSSSGGSVSADAWGESDCSLPSPAHPKPSRASLGLGFDLNGADESPESVEHSPTDSTRLKPSLGFDSPFWATYAAAMQETPEIIL